MPSFYYVKVPQDLDQPLQELQMEIPPDRDVECLLDELKSQMRGANSAQDAQFAAARRAAMMAQVPKGTEVPENVLEAAGQMQLVENIALLSNSVANGFVGVNLYADDSGALKNLPINHRASEICKCCGRDLQVHGDAWIARIFDNEDDFKRLDFKLSEVSSSAPWVKLAAQQMAVKMAGESAEAKMGRYQSMQPQVPAAAAAPRPAPVLQELTPAECAKDEGNKAFKQGDYEAAVASYGTAIEHDGSMVAARNNRAMALLKLERWQEALADCDAVLEGDPGNVKALLRRGEALKQVGDEGAARAAWESVLKVQPKNKEAEAALAALSQ